MALRSDIRLVERIPSVDEFNFIRSAAGMSKKDTETAAVGLVHSLFSICAYCEQSLVGIGRVVGDGGVYFMIVDLAVLPAYQGQGMGKAIMNELMSYIRKHAKAGSFISLFSNRGLADYYRQFGFEPRDPDSPGMSFMVPPAK